MNLSQKQFIKLSDLVHAECGIHLHDGKKQLLQARLARRLRRTGISKVDAYIQKLETDPDELVSFLDAVSTNHTFFFRESHHFECLTPHHRRIWCAASSSGEEPYSIAIHCWEMGSSPTILATDISTHVLGLAIRGIYPMERVKTVSPALLRKYFRKGSNRWEGHVKVKDSLRRMITYERFNLITEHLAGQDFDIIFCRNVLFYFDKETKEKVVDKLYDALRPGGACIIGGAESLNTLDHRFKYVRPSIYHK
jgi:chemotaxis protein methyltransferase CheR